MSPKQPSDHSPASTREDRLGKALRENLARRKGLVRARKARVAGEADCGHGAAEAASNAARDESASS